MELFGTIVNESLKEKILTSDYFSNSLLKEPLNRIPFDSCHQLVKFSNGFGDNCSLFLSERSKKKLEDGDANLSIIRMGPTPVVNNIRVVIGDFSGKISILVGSSGQAFIGNCGLLSLDLRLGHESEIIIGDKCTANGVRIVAIKSSIHLKKDVMMSDEVLLQGFDQHGIVDIKKLEIINNKRGRILIGKHVWLGRRSTIMPGVCIGDGSIVGTCSLVTSNVQKCTAVGGVPSRTLKENISWCRPWTNIDKDSQDFFDSL